MLLEIEDGGMLRRACLSLGRPLYMFAHPAASAACSRSA